MSTAKPEIDVITAAVLESRKYRNLAPDLVRYLAESELGKRRTVKEAVKAVKNKLHQVAGVYQDKMPYPRWIDSLAACRDKPEQMAACCLEIMQHHASTRERLPVLADFYRQIFALLPGVRSVLDIGCGLNPLALPWMPGAEYITYHAFDVYTDLAVFLRHFFETAGIQGRAECNDLLHSAPGEEADVAFLLKMLPVLEQEKTSRGTQLLEELKVRFLVVSFPLRSLGGREKGMAEHYGSRFTAWLKQKNWTCKQLVFPLEQVFVVNRE